MPNTDPDSPPETPEGLPLVHVAVGVVSNHSGQILIALRKAAQHQGGRWEFPGGKVEAGEAVLDALRRELREEVHLELCAASPLLKIEHDYGDKRVLLDVWRITDFRGQARGLEGQPLRWVKVSALQDYEFPAANRAIVEALLAAPHPNQNPQTEQKE